MNNVYSLRGLGDSHASLNSEDVTRVLHAIVEGGGDRERCTSVVVIYLEREGEVGRGKHRALERHMPAILRLFGGVALNARKYIVEYHGVIGWSITLKEGYADVNSLAPHDNLVAGIHQIAHHACGELLHRLGHEAVVV